MYYLYNVRLNYSGKNRNRLVYFQLEVDNYSKQANMNKHKNFQLIASSKNNLKIDEEQIVQSIVLATTTCHTLLLGLKSTLLLETIFFKCKLCFLSKIYIALYFYQYDVRK